MSSTKARRSSRRPALSLPTLAKRCRQAAEQGQLVEPVLRAEAPWLCAQLMEDAKSPSKLALWGKSCNDDELAQLTITHPEVLRALWSIAEQPFPKSSVESRSFHAGLLHTYGYLLSTIRTPYGFKRTRWVRPELERGLGLPPHTLRPKPVAGTLLGNLSFVLSRLLRQTRRVRLPLSAGANVRAGLTDLPLPSGRRLCIQERFLGSAKTELSIHTELLPLNLPKTWLLIYAAGRLGQEKLITTFMIPEVVVEEFLQLPLGRNQTLRLRFNAALPGVLPRLRSTLRGQRNRRWITPKTD